VSSVIAQKFAVFGKLQITEQTQNIEKVQTQMQQITSRLFDKTSDLVKTLKDKTLTTTVHCKGKNYTLTKDDIIVATKGMLRPHKYRSSYRVMIDDISYPAHMLVIKALEYKYGQTVPISTAQAIGVLKRLGFTVQKENKKQVRV